MLDAHGHVASHTGKNCIFAAGNVVGENYSAQANLMGKPTVWPAMGKAFESATVDLIDRLLAALSGAARGRRHPGKAIRGHSCGARKIHGRPWAGRVVDLRVDDSSDPINELKRLVRYHRAYDHMENGDACSTKKDWDCAVREYGDAEKILPDQMEIVFWHAVTLVTSGRTEESLPLFKRVFARGAYLGRIAWPPARRRALPRRSETHRANSSSRPLKSFACPPTRQDCRQSDWRAIQASAGLV